MKVEFLGSLDVRKEAWLTSRPFLREDEVHWDEVLDMDLSLQELAFYAFRFEAPVFWRELLASFRPFYLWSGSTRTHSHFDLDEEVFDEDILEASRERIAAYQEALKVYPQDLARMELPMTIQTGFVFVFTPRSLSRIFQVLSNHPQPHVQRMLEIWKRALPGDLQIPQKVRAQEPLPPPEELGEAVGSTFRYKAFEGTLVFRYQAIRHAVWSVRDEFYQLSKTDPLFPASPGKRKIRMAILAERPFWEKTIQTRTCWIAHYEIWEPVMEVPPNYEAWKASLPCQGDKAHCKYTEDIRNRLSGKDLGWPCPLWDPEGNWVETRLKALGKSKLTEFFQLWLEKEGVK